MNRLKASLCVFEPSGGSKQLPYSIPLSINEKSVSSDVLSLTLTNLWLFGQHEGIHPLSLAGVNVECQISHTPAGVLLRLPTSVTRRIFSVVNRLSGTNELLIAFEDIDALYNDLEEAVTLHMAAAGGVVIATNTQAAEVIEASSTMEFLSHFEQAEDALLSNLDLVLSDEDSEHTSRGVAPMKNQRTNLVG